jgi:lysophospholipase L1-like esterase
MRAVPTGRLLAALSAVVVLAGCTTGSSAASSGSASRSMSRSSSVAPTSPAAGGSYLALGDSVPFGFRAGLSAQYKDATNFVGYPELVGRDLGLEVINAACPGETTASFLDVTAQSNGCENLPGSGADSGFRDNFPLHVAYDAPNQPQVQYALETLRRNHHIRLITVQIGANDGFLCQSTTADHCRSPAEFQAVGQRVQTNLAKILSTVRSAGHYAGRIVVVNYYALDYNTLAATASSLLNAVIGGVAAANGAMVADSFTAFQKAATSSSGNAVTAGLVLANDVHPSAKGQRLLADTVEAVAR